MERRNRLCGQRLGSVFRLTRHQIGNWRSVPEVPGDGRERRVNRSAARLLPHRGGGRFIGARRFQHLHHRLELQPVVFHPPDRIDVAEALHHPPPGPVLGLPPQSRAMAYRNLNDAKAMQLEQRRQEAVQAAIQFNLLEAGAAIGFQRTTGVLDVISSRPVSKTVPDSRRQSFPGAVPAVAPNSADAIPVAKHFYHPWNISRIILKVAVQRHYAFAPRQTESGGHGRRLAEVLVEVRHADAGVGLLLPPEFLQGRIYAPIIHEDKLQASGPRIEDASEFLQKRTDVFAFIENRDDETERWRRHSANFSPFGAAGPDDFYLPACHFNTVEDSGAHSRKPKNGLNPCLLCGLCRPTPPLNSGNLNA